MEVQLKGRDTDIVCRLAPLSKIISHIEATHRDWGHRTSNNLPRIPSIAVYTSTFSYHAVRCASAALQTWVWVTGIGWHISYPKIHARYKRTKRILEKKKNLKTLF